MLRLWLLFSIFRKVYSISTPSMKVINHMCSEALSHWLVVARNTRRDTEILDSFIMSSVLPFTSETDTGHHFTDQGMSLNVMTVPLHRLFQASELI